MKKGFFAILVSLIFLLQGQPAHSFLIETQIGGSEDLPPDTDPPPPSSSDIDQALLNDFSIQVSEGGPGFCLWSEDWGDPNAPDENVSEEAKRELYSAVSQFSRYSKIMEILNRKVFKIEFYSGANVGTRGCRSTNKITMQNFARFLINSPSRGGFLIIHELGHMIGGRSGLGNQFPLDYLANRSSSDKDCFDGKFLKTYSLRRGSARSESFAEGVALYIYNKKNGRYYDIDNFRLECPETYRWFDENVFK